MNYLSEFKHTVRLPRYASQQIIRSGELPLISFWLSLKTMYAGGSIKNYSKRIQEIAEYTGVCSKSAKKFIEKLKIEGLAFVADTELRLCSKDSLVNRYSLKFYDRIQYNEYKATKAKDIKYIIRAQAIKDNQLQQKSAIDNELKRELKPLAKTEARRKVKIQRIENSKSFNQIHSGIKQSQKSIANIYGNKSKASGNYWVKKLKSKDLVSTQKQKPYLLFKNVERGFFFQYRNSLPEIPMSLYNGNIYQHLPNQIRVII
jgi:hypothetical protein